MREIRAGSGLGDTIYLQSIVRHMIERGQQVTPRSNFPAVFSQLGVQVIPQSKHGNPIVAHYVKGIRKPGTSQFQDMCIMAGVNDPVEMRLDWKARDTSLLAGVRRPILAVMLPRLPMDRTDGFGNDLMPDWHILQQLLDQAHCMKVQIGAGAGVYRYSGIDLDLANKTTISHLLDVASQVNGFIGMCSFMIPLAESLNKPFFSLWSAKGLFSKTEYLRNVTPQKVIHRKDLGIYEIDSAPFGRIKEKFKLFLHKASSHRSDQG